MIPDSHSFSTLGQRIMNWKKSPCSLEILYFEFLFPQEEIIGSVILGIVPSFVCMYVLSTYKKGYGSQTNNPYRTLLCSA